MNDTLHDQFTAFINTNTAVASPPLCPEIKLHLIKPNAPIWQSQPHMFDDHGPRPYWAFAWGSGQALARFLADNPHLVRDKRVLDLGAGSGIAASVTAADQDPFAVLAIRRNATLNHVIINAVQREITENDPSDWDVLLVADVFYYSHKQDFHWLCHWTGKHRTILIADPPRRGLPKQNCYQLARYQTRAYPDIEHPSIKQAVIYSLKQPPPNHL